MGIRGELFSTRVLLQNRTYFFNVKENRLGDLYLNIVESKNRDEGGFDRQSVILFAEDLQEFLKGFDESLRVLEKAFREKRRGKRIPSEGEPRRTTRDWSDPAAGPGARRSEKDPDRDYPPRDFEHGNDIDSDREYSSGGYERGNDRNYGKGEVSRRPRNSSPGRRGDDTGRNFRSSRKPGSGRDFDGPESRRSRYGNKDRDHKPESYRSGDKRESAPWKKRVVVKKR